MSGQHATSIVLIAAAAVGEELGAGLHAGLGEILVVVFLAGLASCRLLLRRTWLPFRCFALVIAAALGAVLGTMLHPGLPQILFAVLFLAGVVWYVNRKRQLSLKQRQYA
jgi:uncharacterized membrane protein